jgi:Xaa-Pro aminopeptidase
MLKTEVQSFYQERRLQLMVTAPDACFIFFGEVESANHRHPFRQGSDFHYLTGFDEPGAVLVLANGKSHLFVSERDESKEIWTGERYGPERSKIVFRVDEAFLESEFETKLEGFIKDSKQVYFTLSTDQARDPSRDRTILTLIQQATRHRGRGNFGNLPIYDPLPLLAQMRMVKDAHEIECMRKACSATARAHLHLLKTVRAGMTEFDAANEFQYSVLKSGCIRLGYLPIFASGLNATTLHYTRNNEILKAGDLLLVDAAGEVDGYTADLTQTFPISSEFSPAQRQIYEAVLSVNREITKLARPGTNYRALHTRSVELITEHLLSLGVLTGTLKENVNQQTCRSFYPHGLGHYLGLDVHDVGTYHEMGRDFELKPGMVMTNEPGLYFRDPKSPYYGIGVRIEDDLLITQSDAEVLTHELPRDVEAIEALRC